MKINETARAGLRIYAVLGALALPTLALAHEGHDDDKPTAAVLAAPAAGSARFAATSDQFELVGVLDGRTVTLYLDRFADNVPIKGAQIEIELGAEKLIAQAVDDAYVAQLPALPAAGTIPVTATVAAGNATDLLAADLVVTRTEATTRTSTQAAAARAGWSAVSTWSGVAIAAVLALLGWIAIRRRSRT